MVRRPASPYHHTFAPQVHFTIWVAPYTPAVPYGVKVHIRQSFLLYTPEGFQTLRSIGNFFLSPKKQGLANREREFFDNIAESFEIRQKKLFHLLLEKSADHFTDKTNSMHYLPSSDRGTEKFLNF